MVVNKPERLSRREREIMDVLLTHADSMSVEDIRQGLSEPPSYSAVRAMMVKLEIKGHVRHREQGLRYVYEPTKPRSAAQQTALRRLVKVFFGGSPRQTVTALLKHDKWTNEELELLQAEIEQARKGRRKS
jgi:predicted transcriptional regulator